MRPCELCPATDPGEGGQGGDEEEGQGAAAGPEGRRALREEGAGVRRLRQRRHDQRLLGLHHQRLHHRAREAQDDAGRGPVRIRGPRRGCDRGAGVSEGGALSSSLSSRPSGPSKALKLGAKGKEVDNFVDKLKSEGETIMSNTGKRSSDVSKALPPPVNVERYGHVVSARTRLDAHIWSSGSTKKINLLKCYVTIMKPRSRNMNYCYL